MALVLLFFNNFRFCPKSVPYYYVSLSHLYPKVVIFAESADCTNWSLRYQNLTLKMSGTLPPYCTKFVAPGPYNYVQLPIFMFVEKQRYQWYFHEKCFEPRQTSKFFSSIFRCDNLDTLNSKINPLLAMLQQFRKR